MLDCSGTICSVSVCQRNYGGSKLVPWCSLHGTSKPRKRQRGLVFGFPTMSKEKRSMGFVFHKVLCVMWICMSSHGDSSSFVAAVTASVGTMDRTASMTSASSKPKHPWQRHRIRIPDSTDGLVNRTSNATSVTSTSLIQIIESEYFDENTGRWCANKSNISDADEENMLPEEMSTLSKDDSTSAPAQWTDAVTGALVAAPSDYALDANQEWLGEWNIAVTSKSSPHGWEYTRVPRRRRRPASPLLRYTHRRRRWLRPVVTTTPRSQRNRRKRPRFYTRALQTIRDDWSFKGFGLTVTKSAVFRNALGVAFRLPLTLNFATWERHPVLPNLSSSVAIFLPQLCLCLFLNLSIRMEYVQRALYFLAHIIPTLCTALFLLLLRGLALAVSALLYPLTRKPLLFATSSSHGNSKYWTKNNLVLSTLLASQPNALRRRRLQSDERIDLTCAWRWSVERGYEFRVFFSHWYCVDLAALLQSAVTNLPAQLSTTASVIKIMDWIPQHAAAVGWCFTGPVNQDNQDLLFTASALLSLSGFFLTEKSSPPPTKSRTHGFSGVSKPSQRRVLVKQQPIPNEQQQSGDLFTEKKSSPTKSRVVVS
jgi:hypothetical protein